jgi:hypothetical protein
MIQQAQNYRLTHSLVLVRLMEAMQARWLAYEFVRRGQSLGADL